MNTKKKKGHMSNQYLYIILFLSIISYGCSQSGNQVIEEIKLLYNSAINLPIRQMQRFEGCLGM